MGKSNLKWLKHKSVTRCSSCPPPPPKTAWQPVGKILVAPICQRRSSSQLSANFVTATKFWDGWSPFNWREFLYAWRGTESSDDHSYKQEWRYCTQSLYGENNGTDNDDRLFIKRIPDSVDFPTFQTQFRHFSTELTCSVNKVWHYLFTNMGLILHDEPPHRQWRWGTKSCPHETGNASSHMMAEVPLNVRNLGHR
jgi:hypothetical protein